MKEKLTNNLAIKLIALFCAFFVWLAVVNVANPIKVSTREVPVTITNDQVLEQADLAYDVVGKKTAVISFKIRTKDDYKVKASDFNAYADLSEMYDVTGAIPHSSSPQMHPCFRRYDPQSHWLHRCRTESSVHIRAAPA